MRICVAGAYGAFGIKHLDALANIDGVTVTSVMGPTRSKIDALAAERGIGHAATTLEECIARDDVDVAIRYGVPQDDDGHSIPLLEECVLPVMTRELAQRFPLPGTLPQAPLLHDDSVSFLTPRPDWAAWFGAAGVAGVPPTGPRFSQADHAIDAALSGAGILLGRTSLIARLLNEGVLVAPYGIALKLPSIYRLVCAAGTESRPQIVAFREWLFGELDREPDVLTGHTVIPGGGPGGWRGKRPG